mmetsp:Transcript_30055/g.65709  ORF Transcript_30055/g.65709 Transcript_30055/m.65709 type:complete len:214 (+) Transcript_30055:2-643(+)
MTDFLVTLSAKGMRLPRQIAEDWLADLIVGVGDMHHHKVLHRDLKPDNVMLASSNIDDGSAPLLLIVDLGTAKLVVDKTSTFAGTPIFMAPEQLSLEPYSMAADVWSIGCTIYFACMQVLPYDMEASDVQTLRANVCAGDFAPMPVEVYGSKLVGIVHQMLSLNPEDRPTLQRLVVDNEWVATRKVTRAIQRIMQKRMLLHAEQRASIASTLV